MKISTTAIAILLSTCSAFALPPEIVCELNYSQNDAQGQTVEFKKASLRAEKFKTREVQINDVKLSVTLEPICPADGRCDDNAAYEIKTSITKNDSKAFSIMDMKNQSDRQFLQLSVGSVHAYSLCDVE